MRKSRERRRDGLFIAEGTREVERALAAGLAPRAIYVAPELLPRLDARAGAEEVSARVLAKMAYRAEPEGVLGVFEAPQRDAPAGRDARCSSPSTSRSPATSARWRAPPTRPAPTRCSSPAPNFDPWNPNAIRASTGAVFTLPDRRGDAAPTSTRCR